MINKKIKTTLAFIFILALFSYGAYGIKSEKVSIEKDNKISLSINAKPIDIKDKYLINGKLYVPVRDIFELIGIVVWNQENKHVALTTYKDFEECNYKKGEHFVYGLITKVDYDKKTINIEQHFDDNSREVISPLVLKDDIVIILKRNDKMMNLDIKDLKCGDCIGAVLDKDDNIRGIIITF